MILPPFFLFKNPFWTRRVGGGVDGGKGSPIPVSRSKYTPHQGEREKERRVAQIKKRDDQAMTLSYEEIGQTIGRLVDKSNRAYGDAFHRSGEIIRILYPRGVRPDQVDDMLAIIRIIDKMFRIATNRLSAGANPRADIAGSAILMCRDLFMGQGSEPGEPGGDKQ